jgi:hypothetical protein
MEKKREKKPNNDGNIKSAYLIILDYVSQGVRIINTQSYSLLVVHLLLFFYKHRAAWLIFYPCD